MSYATGQLARALARLTESGDPGALKKIRQWEDVIAGVRDGTVTVGSRTPVADTPAWVTLEVAHGGFATGRYLSEVPLSKEEQVKLGELSSDVPGETDRERLNLWYLSDEGQAELLAALRAGRYWVDLPEDMALAVVALLLDKGFAEQALDLVAELRPLMHRLRFVPGFVSVPRPSGMAVRLATVREVSESLRAVQVPQQLAVMRETLGVWNPLYDRLVALWCQTVDGELPYLEDGVVHGGWPCKQWPDGWADERAQWLADYAATAREHTPTGRHAHKKSNFVRLHTALLNSDALSARDVGWIRRAIANTVTRNGAPGSSERTELRAAQTAVAVAPTHEKLAKVLVNRLDQYPAAGGLASIDPVVEPVDGVWVPYALHRKVMRAMEAPADVLIRHGVITSGEVLATVLPQVTSRLMSSGINDPMAAEWYEQTYTAFRRRRSLLLLNLEHQVQFSELPWVRALSAFRTSEQDDTLTVRHALQQTSLLAMTAFPYAIMPNPLVRELGALTGKAGVKLPLVEEVAADIFMGTFTTKWREAAIVASRTMAGTLYANYYDLPPESQWAAQQRTLRRWGKKTSRDFADLCASRAREAGTGRGVAANGAVLEQSQILTTHNLAVLVDGLGLTEQVRERAEELSGKAFEWALRRLTQPTSDRHVALIQIKQAAYAWRQAIYLLSFGEPSAQKAMARRLSERVGDVPRFAPAIRGLSGVIHGQRFDADGTFKGGKRFLGWAVGKHWLLDG